MTTTINNEHKKLNFSSEREQSQACLNSAEHEKNQGRKVLNVPNLRFKEFQGEWEKCKLSEICTFFSGGTPSSSNKDFYGGNIAFIRSGELHADSTELFITQAGFDSSSAKMVEVGDLLLAMYGATSGDIAVSKIKGAINQAILCIRTKQNKKFIESVWNKHVSKNLRKYLQGGQGNLSADIVKGISFFFPTLKEQEKIANLVSLLDERIATQNKIIDKLQSLIKGINQRVFMNNGINYKLGEVCEIRSGYSGNQLLSKKGLKVSRIETISGHKVNLERVGYVAPFESSENYKLQVGDILFSNINSVEYIGNTAFIDKDYNLYHGMNLLRLTPNNMVVIPFYLYLLLNTNRMLNRFKTVCNKAVSQASINQTELGKTVVQIPDINAQKQICELYQALYDKLESEKYANSLFQKQKQYLLRQMFI